MSRRRKIRTFLTLSIASFAMYLTLSVSNNVDWTFKTFTDSVNITFKRSSIDVTESTLPIPKASNPFITKLDKQKATMLKSTTARSTQLKVTSTIKTSVKATNTNSTLTKPSLTISKSMTTTTTMPVSTMPASTIPTSTIPTSEIEKSALAASKTPTATMRTSVIPTSEIPKSTIPTSAMQALTIPKSIIPTSTIPISTILILPITTVTIPTSTIPTSTIPTSTIPTTTIPTSTIPTSTIPTSTIPTSTIPTSAIPTSTIPTSTIPTSTIPTSTIPTSTIPISKTPTSTLSKSTPPTPTLLTSIETTITILATTVSTIPPSKQPLSTISISKIPNSAKPESTLQSTKMQTPKLTESTSSTSVIALNIDSKSKVLNSSVPNSTMFTSKKRTSAISKITIPTPKKQTNIPGSLDLTSVNLFGEESTPLTVQTEYNPISNENPGSSSPDNNNFQRTPVQLYHVAEVNCAALFGGDKNATEKAKQVKTSVGTVLTDEYYMNATTDCDDFQLSRGYIMSSLTEDERRFPIAYSLVVYKDSEMVERILRAIYRPQNYYCIHIDLKANVSFYNAMAAIAQCFPNVFLSTQRVDVKWGEFSVLESELVCMKELWRYRKWKYFINLTGQEFPLKTNFELVKILEAFKGANSINGTLKHVYAHRWRDTTPPHGIIPLKGSVHITANRDFVDYVLHNETAHALLEWTNKTIIPDETFFSTLNFNPQLGIKGSFKGDPDSIGTFISRYKIWDLTAHLCAGHFVRQICILGLGDLPRLGAAIEMFANKFFLSEDRVVIGCLEEKLFNDTRGEYLGVQQFNASFYGDLNFVTDQVT